MYSLKASLKALINLTNIPCFEPEEKGFNPKGNTKVKRELFLDKSPSSGQSPQRPWSRCKSGVTPPALRGCWGQARMSTNTRATRDRSSQGPSDARTSPSASRARIRPPSGLVPPPPGTPSASVAAQCLYLRIACLCPTPLSQMLEEQLSGSGVESVRPGL